MFFLLLLQVFENFFHLADKNILAMLFVHIALKSTASITSNAKQMTVLLNRYAHSAA